MTSERRPGGGETGDKALAGPARAAKRWSMCGSGVGLAIARSFVELQGGRMEIEVDGDLFKVRLEF